MIPLPLALVLLAGSATGSVDTPGTTALHRAAEAGDLELARKVILSGASPTVANRYGVTPLVLACSAGNAPLVKLLLQAGASPHTALRGGETPLMIAARSGAFTVVDALLEKGARTDATERHGQNALMWAAAEGHTAVVDRLLKAGADFKTSIPGSGFTPLFFAVREGREKVVRRLLKAGADVNDAIRPLKPIGRGPRAGMSPLLMAVENGHFELAVMLLEQGAKPTDQRSGFTALHSLAAVRRPNRGDEEDGDPVPTGSGRVTSLQLARKLIEHGADVNARLETGKIAKGTLTRKGATAFLLAAAKADLPFLKLLIELGANPALGNAENSTPLLAAAGLGTMAPEEEAGSESEVLEVVRFLLTRGADINEVDANGESIVHAAAYKHLPQVVKLAGDRGAKPEIWNRKNRWGWTPTLIAQGSRVGNFRPSPETQAALRGLLSGTAAESPPFQRPELP